MHFKSTLLGGVAALQWAAPATAAKLLSGGTIIAWDTEAELPQVIRGGSVLIEGDRITSVSNEAKPAKLPTGTDIIDVTDKIITPGFVDTHRHGWQTVYKTLASNTTLAEYFARYGEFAAAGNFTADQVYISQLAGIYEALNAGVTTILDHAHHTWSPETSEAGLRASHDSGARIFWAYAFHNITNFTVPQQLTNFEALWSDFESNTTTMAVSYDSFGANPHGQETKDLIQMALEKNVSVITSHYVGGPFGFINSPEVLNDIGILDGDLPIVLSHCSEMTFTDAQLLRDTNQYLSITPESEMHYGHLHPGSDLIQDQAALGIDTHFTFSTDILTQARIWLQSARTKNYHVGMDQWKIPANNPMSVTQAFSLATRKGGLALRRPDLGIIAADAKADILVWNGRSPSMLGWTDPIAAVILHASIGDIEHVLLDGEFKKQNGSLVLDDYEGIQDRFLEAAKQIQDHWKSVPLPNLEGLWTSGAEYTQVPQLDTQRGEGDGYGPTYV